MRERVINFDPWTGTIDNEIKPEDVRKFFDDYLAKIAYQGVDPDDPDIIKTKYVRAYALLGDAKVKPMPPDPDHLDNPTEKDLRIVEDIAAIVVAAKIQFCRWAAEVFLS